MIMATHLTRLGSLVTLLDHGDLTGKQDVQDTASGPNLKHIKSKRCKLSGNQFMPGI